MPGACTVPIVQWDSGSLSQCSEVQCSISPGGSCRVLECAAIIGTAMKRRKDHSRSEPVSYLLPQLIIARMAGPDAARKLPSQGYSLAKGYLLGDTQGPRRYPHALELDIGPESVAVEAACAARTGSAHTHEHPKSWFRTLLGRFDVAPSSSTPGCPFTMSVRIFAVFFAVPSFRVLRRWKYSFLTPGFRAHLCQ